jgi:hypothetical protein
MDEPVKYIRGVGLRRLKVVTPYLFRGSKRSRSQNWSMSLTWTMPEKNDTPRFHSGGCERFTMRGVVRLELE